jgi:hypothetical protein
MKLLKCEFGVTEVDFLKYRIGVCQGLFDLPDEGRKLKAEEPFSASNLSI